MALTSTEIARLLQPMKDFAPAILRCAEIVASAEQAEVFLREQAVTIRDARQTIDALALKQREAEVAAQSVRAEVEVEKGLAWRQVQEFARQVAVAKDEALAADAILADAHRLHAETIVAYQVEIKGLTDDLAAKKQALDEFKRSMLETA